MKLNKSLVWSLVYQQNLAAPSFKYEMWPPRGFAKPIRESTETLLYEVQQPVAKLQV